MSPANYSDPPLRSELVQMCVLSSRPDWNQRLAWVNSLCLAYVVIGVAGLRPPDPVVREVAPMEQPTVMVIEPSNLPPPLPSEESAEDTEDTPPL